MCKISVIVPVYNAEDTLETALSSVFMQTLTDIEILCINDGSTDHSADVLTSAQRRDGRVRCLTQENAGAGIARNKGIAGAKGEYIAFLDADDLYPGPYALETLLAAAEKSGAMVCGGSIEKAKGNDVHPMFVFTEEGFHNACDEPLDRFFARFIYNRNFLLENKLQFPPLRVYEDPIFLLCTLLKAKEYYAVPDVVYRYNGTHSNKRITLACTKDYLRGLIAELKLSKKKDLPEIHTLCCDRLMREADFYAQLLFENGRPGAARTITRGKRRRFTAAAQGPAGGRQRHLARFAHHLARGLPLSALAGSAHHPHAMRRVCKVAMRAKRSFFNAFSGLFSQFVSVALGVIIPRLVLVQLGSEANGLLSATQQALVYLDLLESGIGTAALQALYKPAAEQDRAAVSGIFNAIHREYAKVGIAYAALVCGLSVLFPFFIKTELPFFTVLLTVLLGGMGQAVRFLFQAKYRVLLQAEGRGYVLINANLLLTVSISIGKIILLICGLSLIAVQLLCFLCGLLQTALLTLYAKKQYSWLNRAVPPDTTATAQHRAVLVHQISGLIFQNTDVLLLSVVCGLKATSVYSMYVMLFRHGRHGSPRHKRQRVVRPGANLSHRPRAFFAALPRI